MRPFSRSFSLVFALSALAACSNSSDATDSPGGTGTDPPAHGATAVAKSDKPRDDGSAVSPADQTAVSEGNNAFAFDLYGQLLADADNSGKNLFFSPISITLALGMTSAGTKGATQSEIAQAMHFTLPQASLQPALNHLSQQISQRPQEAKELAAKYGGDKPAPEVSLNLVNALWGDQSDSWQTPFLDTLAINYGAGMNLGDFIKNADGERLTINQWVSDQTQARIKDLLAPGSLDDTTRIVLVNAINLTFPWETPFIPSQTKPGPFTVEGGSSVSAPLMATLLEQGVYAEDSLAQYSSLRLYGGALAVEVFVPKEGQFSAFEGALAAETASLRQAAHTSAVNLTLPKFTYTSPAVALGPAFRKLGMQTPFGDGADLSGMTTTEPLHIQEIYHKAMVGIDEGGIQAAAATAVVGGTDAAIIQQETLHVDRSFFLDIRDTKTGAILFFGRILDPTQG